MAWAPDYLTVDDAKRFVRVDDDVDDAELAVAIAAASRAIDRECRRQFGRVDAPQKRRYTAWETCDDGELRWVVDIDDLQDDGGLVVDVDGAPVTAYELEPYNAPMIGKAYTRLVLDGSAVTAATRRRVSVTAAWGWLEVPAAVTLACQLQTARFLARRESPFGIAGSPDDGSELRLLARLDPDVAVSLAAYRRPAAMG